MDAPTVRRRIKATLGHELEPVDEEAEEEEAEEVTLKTPSSCVPFAGPGIGYAFFSVIPRE